MKKVIIILLITVSIAYSKTKVLLYSHLGDEEHTALVWQSFIEEYGNEFDTNYLYQIISNTISTQAFIDSCHSLNIDIVVFPYTGALSIRNYIESNPQTINFIWILPAGSNEHIQCFPVAIPDYMILCGATDTNTLTTNATGYNITFHVPCLEMKSSYATGKIAGIFAKIFEWKKTFSDTKQFLIANRNYTNENGYGIPSFKNKLILIK